MSWGGPAFVVAMIAIMYGGWILNNWIRARHGYPLHDKGGALVGICTSGSPGPTVGKNIGMGYVPSAMAGVGQELLVDCRGKNVEAVVVKTPFYKRK